MMFHVTDASDTRVTLSVDARLTVQDPRSGREFRVGQKTVNNCSPAHDTPRQGPHFSRSGAQARGLRPYTLQICERVHVGPGRLARLVDPDVEARLERAQLLELFNAFQGADR